MTQTTNANEQIKNLKFITIPENRQIGKITLRNDIPLPVLFEDGQDIQEVELTAIVAGLIKVIAYDCDNQHFEYYKTVLLEMQPEVIKELNAGAIAKSKKKEYLFAMELMLAVNHLCELPETYGNLAVLYAEMSVEYSKKEDQVNADIYDDKIAQILNDCIQKYPDYAPAYKELSAFHLRHTDIENSKNYLEKFIELTDSPSDKEQAETMMGQLKKILSNKDQILYAYDKMMMGQSDETIEICNKFLEQNEPTWEVFFLRGWAQRTLSNYEQAQKDLLESLRLESNNAEAYNELSICAKECGNTELAKNYLEIAADLDPESVVYLTNLAFLQLSDKEFEESRSNIEKAKLIDPEDPQLIYIIQQYEQETGEEISDPIKEEFYSEEELQELTKHEHNHNHNGEEL